MSVKRILSISAMSILGLVALIAIFTSWYTVDESEQAVVITFGKAEAPILESGLHFKLPWPMQKVEILSKETFSLQFGYQQSKDGEIISFDNETKMITGDENIVLTDLVVQWKITDPAKYLFNAGEPKVILHDATSASIRSIVSPSGNF